MSREEAKSVAKGPQTSSAPSRKRGRATPVGNDGTGESNDAVLSTEQGGMDTTDNVTKHPVKRGTSRLTKKRARVEVEGRGVGDDDGMAEEGNAALGSQPSSSSRRAARAAEASDYDDSTASDVDGDEGEYLSDDSVPGSSPSAATSENLVVNLEKQIVDFRQLQKEIQALKDRRHESKVAATLVAVARDPYSKRIPVIKLVVGGESFTVPIHTLISREPNTYFHALLYILLTRSHDMRDAVAEATARDAAATSAARPEEAATAGATGDAGHTVAGGIAREAAMMLTASAQGQDGEHGTDNDAAQASDNKEEVDLFNFTKATAANVNGPFPANVFTDSNGAIFIDRDPGTFRHILNYLRGYRRFNMLEEEELNKLRIDAEYFQLPGLQELISEAPFRMDHEFQLGPGVNVDRNRFRLVYSIATVGDTLMVAGKHSITFKILANQYVGLGLVSSSFSNSDSEFHKTPQCAVYYMSGVFYTNFPDHVKEEGLTKFENGEYVTLTVDLDKGYAEFIMKKGTKLFTLGRARRLRFAVALKLDSQVRIVSPEEAAQVEEERRRESAVVDESATSRFPPVVQALPTASPGNRSSGQQATSRATGTVGGGLSPHTTGRRGRATTAQQQQPVSTSRGRRGGNTTQMEHDLVRGSSRQREEENEEVDVDVDLEDDMEENYIPEEEEGNFVDDANAYE